MRRRALAIGENVSVASHPGHGTTVKLKLHFAPSHSNGKVVA
jgi:signal transduction histidine kinase